MNSLFGMLGIESWKPLIGALLLPPVPLLLLVLVGARLLLPRRGLGWFVIVMAVIGLWLSGCAGFARLIEPMLLRTPPALTASRIGELRAEVKAEARADKSPASAIVVLGGGLEPFAPEYGVSNLTRLTVERLRYGIWLSRETGMPLAFSGGAGWGQNGGANEAQIAARIAKEEFGRPLRWTEEQSRDTRGNANLTVPMLQKAGITRIVLVTHGTHMTRALRAFREAAQPAGLQVEAAPMGLAGRIVARPLDWLPTGEGIYRVRYVLHEAIGLLAGA